MTSSANLDPSPAAWAALKALLLNAPVPILNLIRLKPLAIYPAYHPEHGKGLSGLDAYRAYEHDYVLDYRAKAGAYVDASMATVKWSSANARFAKASAA